VRALENIKRRAWLRLARTEHVGPVTFASLIARFGSASAALAELPRMAARGGGKNFVLPPDDEIAREMENLARLGGWLIAACEPDFPQGLAALEPPPIIAVLGNAPLLKREMVAIVGARNASALARKFAYVMAQELTAANLAIASGMARGIDSAAHEGALAGGTVAVLAGGVDVIYPPENEKLYGAIRAQGAVISEMRLGEQPQARHFPRRNRLISGLSRGIVVVEAAERSGSLISAQYALEQGARGFRRTGFAAGSARQGRQPPHTVRRHPDRKRGRCAGGAGAHPRQPFPRAGGHASGKPARCGGAGSASRPGAPGGGRGVGPGPGCRR
jgi:DNA processing protein